MRLSLLGSGVKVVVVVEHVEERIPGFRAFPTVGRSKGELV